MIVAIVAFHSYHPCLFFQISDELTEAHGRDDEVERRIGLLEMELGEMTTFFIEIDITPIQNLFWLEHVFFPYIGKNNPN
jgi:hypothetical protein